MLYLFSLPIQNFHDTKIFLHFFLLFNLTFLSDDVYTSKNHHNLRLLTNQLLEGKKKKNYKFKNLFCQNSSKAMLREKTIKLFFVFRTSSPQLSMRIIQFSFLMKEQLRQKSKQPDILGSEQDKGYVLCFLFYEKPLITQNFLLFHFDPSFINFKREPLFNYTLN